jgi:hypothetical protein
MMPISQTILATANGSGSVPDVVVAFDLHAQSHFDKSVQYAVYVFTVGVWWSGTHIALGENSQTTPAQWFVDNITRPDSISPPNYTHQSSHFTGSVQAG